MADDPLAAATALIAVRRHEQAIAQLAPYLAAHPDSTEGLCLLAQCYELAGEYREMLSAASRAVTSAPTDAWARRLRSLANRHCGYRDAALTDAREAARLAPTAWHAYLALAEAHLALGTRRVHRVAAFQAATRAVELGPASTTTHITLGRVYQYVGAFGPARDCYRAALRLDPANATALNNLASIDAATWRAVSAGRGYRNALLQAPTDPKIQENLQRTGRMLTAIALGTGTTVLAATLLAAVVLDRGPVRSAVIAALFAVGAALLGYRYARLPVALRKAMLGQRTWLGPGAMSWFATAAFAVESLLGHAPDVARLATICSIPAAHIWLASRWRLWLSATIGRVHGWWYQRVVFPGAAARLDGVAGSRGGLQRDMVP